MIIRKLKLHPFAGLTNYSIEFNEALSVVCGPNEAGKSTTVKALWFALFVKTNLTPAKEKTIISRFLPVTGGDTIKISLEFSVNNQNFIVKKSWGGSKFSELVLPGGTILNDADKVQEKLDELLHFNEATYKNILFTYQSELGKTLEKLKETGDAANSLSDLLRSAVMAQGGVSTEKLIELLEAKKKDYFDNWDITFDAPRNNKDIDSPHKKNVGFILENFYKYRKIEEELKRTQEYEKLVDEAVQEISTSEGRLKEKQNFVTQNKETIKDARERKNLELHSAKLKMEQENLNAVYSKWPELELKITSLKKEEEKLKDDLDVISKELLNAEKRDSLKVLKEKYKSCSLLNEKLIALSNKISESVTVTEEDVEIARQLESAMTSNTVRVEAQKMKLSFFARNNLKIKLKEGIEEWKEIKLQLNEKKETEVRGGFEIETHELKLSVTSGNDNIEELLSEIQDNKNKLEMYLKKFKVDSILNLQLSVINYKNLINEMERIQSNLKTALGDISFDELEKTAKEANEIPLARETNLIRNLKFETAANLKSRQNQLLEINREILQLNVKYASKEDLLNLLVNIKSVLKETETVLGKLLPLPVNFHNTDEFISYYEKCAEEFNELKEFHHKLLIKRAELDNNKPESDTKELEAELESARKEFEKVKKEGNSYLLISNKVEKLLQGTETQTYLPLQQAISKYFAEIANEKYHEVLLDGTLPVRIENNNKGFEIQQLSKGTLDALALATRLGMAEFYLTDTYGFLILDDPLVDLDEHRQRNAASAISQFSKNKQVIVFTCHRSHAKIMQEDYYTMAIS